MTDFLDDLDASRYQRGRLMDALINTARERRSDTDLAQAVQEVFDPADERRPFGPAHMPLTTEDLTGLIETRIRGLERAREPAPMGELQRARFSYQQGARMYSADRQGLVANSLRPQDAAMWEEPTWDHLVNNACYHLSVALGGLVPHGTS